MFLTRKQYDAMIAEFPKYMNSDWLEMQHSWSIEGVRVTASPEQLADLQRRLSVMRP